MNLLAFREFFRKTSGRYDLVNSSFVDTGSDFYINAGQKYLDRLVDIPQAIGRVFREVSSGDYLVTFQDSRSILEVWCIGAKSSTDSATVRLPLTKYSMQDLRGVDKQTLDSNYVELFGDIDSDRPTYYAPAQLRMVGGTTDDPEGTGGLMDVLPDNHQTYNGVLFMPPSDGDYTIEVVGNFYSMTLAEDTDSTFWSDVHPNILYMAAMMQTEIMHRNTEGVKDWKASIDDQVIGIDMDGVNEEVADVEEMDG
jgi:hypothetical protein